MRLPKLLLSHNQNALIIAHASAGDYVCQQVIACCEFIEMRGAKAADGTTTVTFGDLFALYSRYSENVRLVQ